LESSASNIIVNASGASRVKLAAFPVNNVNTTLSGASSGTVNLDGSSDVDLTGALKLGYVGEPTMGTVNTSGTSTLSKKLNSWLKRDNLTMLVDIVYLLVAFPLGIFYFFLDFTKRVLEHTN